MKLREFKIGSVVKKIPLPGQGADVGLREHFIGVVIEVRHGMTGNVLRVAWNDYGTFYEHPQRVELLA